MLELYREHLNLDHNYKIYPYSVAGNDFIYNCKTLKLIQEKPQSNELYAIKYDVNYKDLDFETPNNFMI